MNDDTINDDMINDDTIVSTHNSQLNYRQLLRKYELAFNRMQMDVANSVRIEWNVRNSTSFDVAYEKYVLEYAGIE